MNGKSSDDHFYSQGLEFLCTRCSNCCRHDPGFVFLSKRDIHRLKDGLGITLAEFLSTYCRAVTMLGISRVSLNEKSNFDCIFWEESGCSVYQHRPLQCRAFPFWSANLVSRETWDALKPSCPGVNQGKTYTEKEIDAWLDKRLKEPFVDADDPNIAEYLGG